MIKIDIFRNSIGAIIGFNINGHAGTAPHGQDIVCAAVAALTQTAVMGLEQYLRREISLDISSGMLHLELAAAPDDMTSAVLETMMLGLNEIARQNSRSVRIREHRR